MTIQWFPGHMAKARREVTEKLKLVDIIFELVDARLPFSSRNPMIDEIIAHKPRLVLLNKADMADRETTKQWLEYFHSKNIHAIAINAQEGHGLREITAAAKEALREKFERQKAKGVKNTRAIRAMIVGIPNVGKSTLINRLAKKNIAKTGNMPGVTKAQQWIKVGKELELLDTPGILWPKFEDPEVGYRLALTGAIKDSILKLTDVAMYALKFLSNYYPERLKERYRLTEIPEDIVELMDAIGKARVYYISKNEIDYDKVVDAVIKDFRTEKFGKITLEYPYQVNFADEDEEEVEDQNFF